MTASAAPATSLAEVDSELRDLVTAAGAMQVSLEPVSRDLVRSGAPKIGGRIIPLPSGRLAVVEEWSPGTADRPSFPGTYLVIRGSAVIVYGATGGVDFLRPGKYGTGAQQRRCTVTVTSPVRILRVLPTGGGLIPLR